MPYERFTDRARKVIQFANQEAQRFNHEYIGTEHLFLGLIKEGNGVAANVLKNLDLDLRKVRLEVEKIVRPGPDTISMGRLPRTPCFKKVLEYAIEEGKKLNHNYVGTEHILLGLLREPEGVAATVLTNLGLQLDDVRREVLELLGHGHGENKTEQEQRKEMTRRMIYAMEMLQVTCLQLEQWIIQESEHNTKLELTSETSNDSKPMMDWMQACQQMTLGKRMGREGYNTYYCFDHETGALQYGYINFDEPAKPYPSQKDFFAEDWIEIHKFDQGKEITSTTDLDGFV